MPSTGWGEGIWHDLYIGGWQTIAPTGGYAQTYAGAEIGQHTEATLMPWDAQIVEDTPERVSARFRVRTVRTPFLIEKTLTLDSGSATLRVDDVVINEAEEEAECQWGQHVALGEPFLTPDCRLDIPGGQFFVPAEGDVNPRLERGQTGSWPNAVGHDGASVDLTVFPPKSDRVQDYMAFRELEAGWYAVTNPERGVGFSLAFPTDPFKYLWYWQVFGGGSGYPWYNRTYNVGLEPFSSLASGIPEPGSSERTSLVFAPGERREATVYATAFESTTGVSSVAADGRVTVR